MGADEWTALTDSETDSEADSILDTTSVATVDSPDSAVEETTQIDTWDAPMADADAMASIPDAPSTPPDAPETLPEGLTGQAPPEAKPMPSLAGVVDSTGAPALEDQLLNHWSVLWFYPLASTSG